MSKTLTWHCLTQTHMARIATLNDVASIKQALLDADTDSKAGYFSGATDSQRDVLLDLFYHCLRFARGNAMTAEKQSTLVSIVYTLHSEAMRRQASSKDAFVILEDLLIGHSVHRPPYSAAVFAVDDTKLIIDYLLGTYFRHYKLYLYAFSKRSELTVHSHALGEATERAIQPPPLAKAVPLAQWEAAQAEARRKAEEEQKRLDDIAAAKAAEEARQREIEAAGPPMPEGLRAQLTAIRQGVGKNSVEKLDEMDARLAALEAKLQAEAGKPSSAVGKTGARGPGRK